jgi:tRNA (cytidine32/uridine32-2'-O)-methyltransferase
MLDRIRIVLVETSHPGNIGSAARAMKNMGLSQLVLVKPQRWPAPEASAMAASAQDILEKVSCFKTLAEAVADSHLIIGTSARLRNMPVPLLDPENCAKLISTTPSRQQVALVFGREISGLTNEELQLCHYHVHIPVNPVYSSLNLGAAVMVLAYECRKTFLKDTDIPKKTNTNKESWDQLPATAEELSGFLSHLESILVQLGFHNPDNPRQLMARLRRLFQRIQPDKMEINILRGIVGAISAHFGRQGPQQPGDYDP